MTSSSFWNPKHETLSHAELERLQGEKLKRLVRRAWRQSPFHRRKLKAGGIGPEGISGLQDLRRIPFTTREEWMAAQAQAPPFGDLLAESPNQAIRYHHTSGTSGRTPLRVLDNPQDWQWIAECWAYGFWGFGVRPSDRVFFAFSYGSFIGFWGAHYASEKLGALVIPSGNMNSEARVKQILEMDVTTVCATPTYALRLAQVALELGLDLAASKVNKVIVSGEPAGSIPETKALIERLYGARCGDTAGMTELGTICMFECACQPGGMHIIEDHFIEEVIDPKSGEPLPYGQEGERVVTSFGRAMIPVLRYRTADLVLKEKAERCSCGRGFDLYLGGIRGRVDDMLLIRGTNVYPRAIESLVRAHGEIDEFQILAETIEGSDELTVLVELKPESKLSFQELQHPLARELKEAHEMLRINVREAPRSSLPRFELKARRVVDRREVKR